MPILAGAQGRREAWSCDGSGVQELLSGDWQHRQKIRVGRDDDGDKAAATSVGGYTTGCRGVHEDGWRRHAAIEGSWRSGRQHGGPESRVADRRVAWRTGESRGATKGDWQRGQLTASDEGDWRGGRLRDAARGSGVRPANPLPTGMSPLAYVHDLTFRHGLALSAAAAQAWKTFEECLQFRFSPSPERRVLRLEPHAQDSIPSHFQHLHIDVAARGVDGRSRLYKLRDVTGVDERVQAVVAGQKATADCLLAAVGRVEEEDAHEFSFVCHGATHRSVACCMLLAALAYPRALVHMSTARTRCAAAAAGLPTSVC